MDFPLLLMSFLVGALIGLTSMGGAALMAPFLILVVGVRPAMAVQTDLIYGAITKMVGAWMHWRQGTVDFGVARRLAMGSIPGGLLGSAMVFALPRLGVNADQYLKRAIGIALLAVAVVLLTRMVYHPSAPPRAAFLHGWATVAWGALVGFCVGMTSVGSGSLIAPFLMLLFPLAPAKVVGTDVFHAAMLVAATALAHASAGGVAWHLVATLLAGSIPGVILGSQLAPRVPATALRACLAVVLLATGIHLV